MARLPRIPRYRRHSSGQARVTLGGKDHLLGPYGSPASREAYERLVSRHAQVAFRVACVLSGSAAKPFSSGGVGRNCTKTPSTEKRSMSHGDAEASHARCHRHNSRARGQVPAVEIPQHVRLVLEAVLDAARDGRGGQGLEHGGPGLE